MTSFFVRKDAPMVDEREYENWPEVYRCTIEVLPTPTFPGSMHELRTEPLLPLPISSPKSTQNFVYHSP